MRKLEISITKAQLTSFSVQLEDSKPVVRASIALLTAGGKPITSYDIATNSWQEENKFELPVEAFMPIVELSKILERVVVKHCRDSQKALPPKTEKEAELTKVSTLEEPINLDDIPF